MAEDHEYKPYTFVQIHRLNQEFFDIFGVYFEPYMDKMMSVFIFNRPTLDVIKFDQYLQNRFSSEYVDGISMAVFVANKFGYKGWRMLKNLM